VWAYFGSSVGSSVGSSGSAAATAKRTVAAPATLAESST
jgi:hypothetical protein